MKSCGGRSLAIRNPGGLNCQLGYSSRNQSQIGWVGISQLESHNARGENDVNN